DGSQTSQKVPKSPAGRVEGVRRRDSGRHPGGEAEAGDRGEICGDGTAPEDGK
ncbi:hypothetical protein NQZ68_017033, partial [Dissostichus eleginoides]